MTHMSPARASTDIGPSDPGQDARGDGKRHALLSGDDGASYLCRPSSEAGRKPLRGAMYSIGTGSAPPINQCR